MGMTEPFGKSEMERLVGQSIDHYQIVSLLGQGGMGAVFKAQDLTLQRDVAFKVMHPQFAQQPDFQERFLQEARTAAHLDHPGIVKVFDFGKSSSILYIVMEFIPGDNLRQLLKDLKAGGKWIVLPEAVQLVRQVCVAIDYAHRQGVLHRDIKPDNIMLKSEPSEGLPYRPILTDLGLAKLLEGGMMTMAGVSMGTPAYMSPEQALGQNTDARSDVYSLGVLMYELAVGQLPFPVTTVTEAIRYHTKEPPPAPRSIRPDLPEPVQRVILRALEKDPVARFATAQAMAQALADSSPQASAPADLARTALGQAVSLITQHQASMVKVRGESVLKEFPSTPGALTQDRVNILAPDHSIGTANMKPEGLTIGRDPDNDIVLNYDNVSRHHARINFTGVDYQVTDLNSTNGTFIASFKLLPGIPEIWTTDKPLRVGDSYLRLERRPASAASRMSGFGGTMAASGPVKSAAGAGRVGVFTETKQLSVIPGSSALLPVTILNQGEVVDSFAVTAEGIPSNWVSAPPPLLRLLPGMSQDISLILQPPRSPQSRANVYPLTIRVASQDAPDQVGRVQVSLTVLPFHQIASELKPEKIKAGQPAQVILKNQGNSPEPLQVNWQDQADELAFSPVQTLLTVPEGQQSAVKFTASTKQRRWIGGEKQYPFNVLVTPTTGNPLTHPGQAVSTGLIPLWLPPLLVLACVSLCACLLFLFAKPPVIQSFTYSPSSPLPGQPVKISWAISNAQKIEFNPPIMNVDPSTGSYVFSDPTAVPKDLTVTASNMFGTVSRPLSFGFVPPTPTPTPQPGAPVIEEWSVNPTSAVDGDKVTIHWKVSNADTITLQPFGTVDVTGDMTDTVHTTKTYTIIASNQGKTVQRAQEVFVVPATPTPDVNATAQVQASQTAAAQQTMQAQQAIAQQTQQAQQAIAQQTQQAQNAMAQQTKQAQQATKQANDQATAAAKKTQQAGATQTAMALAGPTQTAAAQQTAQAARYAQYNGNWINDDPNTNGITRLQISNSGATITVHGYGKCSPTDCDWGNRSGIFTNEPFVILFDFGGGLTHRLTISRTGNKISVVDVGSASGTHTYTFHTLNIRINPIPIPTLIHP